MVDGDPVTANDFVYAWKRLADPATASEYAWYIELMQVVNATEVLWAKNLLMNSVSALLTIRPLRSKSPHLFLISVNDNPCLGLPVNQKVVETNGDKWTEAGTLVGNGAYVLKEHILGEKVVMERNPLYWDDANTIIQTATALTINDNDAALTRYLAGELDRVAIPAGQYPRLKEEYPNEAISVPQSCSYIYMFNLDKEKGPAALQDVNVRRALSYAIDRGIVVNNILQGGQSKILQLDPSRHRRI